MDTLTVDAAVSVTIGISLSNIIFNSERNVRTIHSMRVQLSQVCLIKKQNILISERNYVIGLVKKIIAKMKRDRLI